MIKILFVKRNRSYLPKSIIAWKNEKIKILAKVACPELLVLGVDKQKCMFVYLWVTFLSLFADFVGVLNSGVLVHGVFGKKRSILHLDFQWSP